MKFTYATLLSLILTLLSATLWICGYVTEELNPLALHMLFVYFVSLSGLTLLTTLK